MLYRVFCYRFRYIALRIFQRLIFHACRLLSSSAWSCYGQQRPVLFSCRRQKELSAGTGFLHVQFQGKRTAPWWTSPWKCATNRKASIPLYCLWVSHTFLMNAHGQYPQCHGKVNPPPYFLRDPMSLLTLSEWRPFALREAIILRPFFVDIRWRKPCLFRLFLLCGWNVLFIILFSRFIQKLQGIEFSIIITQIQPHTWAFQAVYNRYQHFFDHEIPTMLITCGQKKFPPPTPLKTRT